MMRTSGRFQVQWRGAAVDLNFVRSTDTTAAADDADVNHGDSIFDNRVVPSSSSVEIAPIIYSFVLDQICGEAGEDVHEEKSQHEKWTNIEEGKPGFGESFEEFGDVKLKAIVMRWQTGTHSRPLPEIVLSVFMHCEGCARKACVFTGFRTLFIKSLDLLDN
ncbi:hypothetical protein E3N88_01700 [Mikania micrantha]|uniref:Uncharacterized protein n=1 Tax=Mikania micrantha TaxID=192012 RepID=A0A5N6Q1P2_9ASTR|nr:hypothetical protein E3N88_01700 [Mikania micrantha]